jgi:hypothetical protein
MFSTVVRLFLGAAALSAVLLTGLPSAADDVAAIDPQARVGSAGWRVDGVSGDAAVRRGSLPAAQLAVGQVISIGSEVQTGPGAIVFLSRNGDRLVIQPNSRMRIAEPEPGGVFDHFMQSLGNVFYDVEPRRNRSFGVSAPYVAAVVKGTKFLVTVEAEKNSVRVDEGRVLVTSEDGASSVLVDAGHLATVEPAWAGIRVTDSGVPVEAPDDAASTHAPSDGGSSGGANAVDAAANSAAGTVKSATSALGNAVTQTGNAVGSAVGEVSDGVGKAVGGASKAVGGAVAGVGGAVGGAVGGPVGGAVGGATGAVGGVVAGVGGAVGGVVGGVGGAVGGVVGGLGGGLGGLVGGRDRN